MNTTEALDTTQFRATTGSLQEFGATPQEALNSLMQHLSPDDATTIMILPFNRGDVYFTDTQQARLQELKARQPTLSKTEREELDGLIAASFDATITRTQPLLRAAYSRG